MTINEYFSKIIPCVSIYSIKRDPIQSYITLEGVIGPLPINKTALEILDLCDGVADIYSIYTSMTEKYPTAGEKKIFKDVIQCIRNYEIIGALNTSVI